MNIPADATTNDIETATIPAHPAPGTPETNYWTDYVERVKNTPGRFDRIAKVDPEFAFFLAAHIRLMDATWTPQRGGAS